MKRYRGLTIFTAAFLVFIALMLYLQQRGNAIQQRPSVRLSVVLYGQNDDRWRSLEMGISQACDELGIGKPVLLVRDESGPAQLERIQRELDGGVAGLLVAVADSGAMQSQLENLAQTWPLVLVETGAGDALACVGANDAAMGRLLAEHIGGSGKTVAVLDGNTRRQSVANRRQAFTNHMRDMGNQVVYVDIEQAGQEPDTIIASYLASHPPDVVAALDNETLETALRAVPAAMVQTKLYGIGASETVVHALDTGELDALCYANEYAVGYQATMQLAQKLGLAPTAPSQLIQYGIATRDNLYDPEVERILFPVIQ